MVESSSQNSGAETKDIAACNSAWCSGLCPDQEAGTLTWRWLAAIQFECCWVVAAASQQQCEPSSYLSGGQPAGLGQCGHRNIAATTL